MLLNVPAFERIYQTYIIEEEASILMILLFDAISLKNT